MPKRSGNPAVRAEQAKEAAERAKKPPVQIKLERATELSVELVQELRPHLPDDVFLYLRAGSLGLLWVMAAVTGKPSPDQVVDQDLKSIEQIKADVWEEAALEYRKLHPGPWPTNPYKRRRR